MGTNGRRIKELLNIATPYWLQLTKTYKILLQNGYNKTFTDYLKDLKAREVWIKINK